MGPIADAVMERRDLRTSPIASPIFLARVSKPSEPRQVKLPAVVALTRARVFDLAADAHAVASSIRGLGLDPQVAVLDRMVSELEACLVAQAQAHG